MAFSVADLVTPSRVLAQGTVGNPEHVASGASVKHIVRNEEPHG